jgi:hypothetical protein
MRSPKVCASNCASAMPKSRCSRPTGRAACRARRRAKARRQARSPRGPRKRVRRAPLACLDLIVGASVCRIKTRWPRFAPRCGLCLRNRWPHARQAHLDQPADSFRTGRAYHSIWQPRLQHALSDLPACELRSRGRDQSQDDRVSFFVLPVTASACFGVTTNRDWNCVRALLSLYLQIFSRLLAAVRHYFIVDLLALIESA